MRNSVLRRASVVLFLAAFASAAIVGCGRDAPSDAPPLSTPAPDVDASDNDDASVVEDPSEEGDGGEYSEDDGEEDPDPPPEDIDLDAGDAGGPPTPVPTPIRYVMVLIKENHTFDNYFTGFPGANSTKTATLSDGTKITRKEAPVDMKGDICHSNSCATTAYNGGKMDRFDTAAGNRQRPFYYYSEQQIPNYWSYARNFVLADNFFQTIKGPSAPGHAVFWSAQSMVYMNPKCPDGVTTCNRSGCMSDPGVKVGQFDPIACTTKQVKPCFDVPSLVDHLPKNFTWRNYGSSFSRWWKPIAAEAEKHRSGRDQLVRDLEGYDAIIDGGTVHVPPRIHNLTIAHLTGGETAGKPLAGRSEHPPAYPCEGENDTVRIINAAMKLPQWKEMAIILTWDDWGGWYDHVPPPKETCSKYNKGFRLPLIVISPYAKTGVVLHTPTEQASVPRLVEELWGMKFMSTRDRNARDGRAGSLMGAFDFKQTPRAPMLHETHACPAQASLN